MSVAYILAFWILAVPQNVDDKDRVIVIGDDPQPQKIELGGMIEGVACRYEFVIRNDTDVDIRDVSTRVTCGCLRATELEGKTLPAKGELTFKASVLPTANNYNQTLTLGGVTPDGNRKEAGVANFTGKVAQPLNSTPRSISVAELKSGPVRLKIGAQKGVSFDLKKAVLLDERFRLEVSDNDEIVISTQMSAIVEQELLLQVPFRVRETEFTYTLRIEVLDSLLRIAPTSLVLTEDDGHYVGRFVVQSKVEKILEKLEVSVEDTDASASTALKAEFSFRQTPQVKIYQFKLPVIEKRKDTKLRIVVRSVSGDEVLEKTIQCLIPKSGDEK